MLGMHLLQHQMHSSPQELLKGILKAFGFIWGWEMYFPADLFRFSYGVEDPMECSSKRDFGDIPESRLSDLPT